MEQIQRSSRKSLI